MRGVQMDSSMRSVQMERMRSLSDLPKLHEFQRAVQMEIAQADGREEMFLRSSSGLSALFKALGHEHGRAYFRYVLRDVFGEKSTLFEKPATPTQVRDYAKSIIQRLVKALHFAPLVLRAACQFVLREFRKAFPASRQHATIVVGGVVFLRIVCPALIKPEILGYQPHTAKSLPVGVQVAKMLQHTLSGNLLSENHPDFALSNVFIRTFQPQVANFLDKFPQVRAAQQPLESPRPAEVLCVKPWESESARDPQSSNPNSWEPHPSKLRGMSMSTEEAGKRKRKFSFRFWTFTFPQQRSGVTPSITQRAKKAQSKPAIPKSHPMFMELAADLTCVVAFGSRIFAGDASGFVRCYAATSGGGGGGDESNSSSRETERGSSNTSAPADGSAEVPLSTPEWIARAAQGAILSLCVIRDPRATSSHVTALKKNNNNSDADGKDAAAPRENLLLVAGAASGELVFFRNETEARRLQLESAVLKICAHRPEAEFLAGDLLGTLYGVNQYGVLWKERLGDVDAQGATPLSSQVEERNGGAFFYPPTAQPVFKAIASITVPDIESTLSSYALLSTGQHHLIATHQGEAFAYIPTSAPMSTIASFSPGSLKDQEDVILVAGEEGKIYQIRTSREPSFRFMVELWAEVSFPIAKVLHIGSATSASEADNSQGESFTWGCLGQNGQVALFRGKELMREWNSATSSHYNSSNNSGFPVDATVVNMVNSSSSTSANLAKKESKMVAIAFPDRIQLFAVSS